MTRPLAFPWTLQRYLFREMGRTFLLTAVALTGVLGLGGGVMNMIELGDVTPGQLLELMGLILPVAAALTLPIATLFSATATYGRLSADNEFVACRSGGINLHILFLPALILSLVSAAITFMLISFVIPGMVRNLNELISADIGKIIQRRLNRPRGITLGGRFRIYADKSVVDVADANHITLHRIAFVEVDEDQWVRFGTAREVNLEFDRSESKVRLSGWMAGLSYYDRKLQQFVEEERQTIPTNELPSLVPREIKFLNLRELLYYGLHPQEWRDVREEFRRLRMAVGRMITYDAIWSEWLETKQMNLTDDRHRWVIRAGGGARVPREGGIEFTDVTVTVLDQSQHRSYQAQRAVLEIPRADSLEDAGIVIRAYDVTVIDGDQEFDRSRVILGPVQVPSQLIARVGQLNDEQLLDPQVCPQAGETLTQKRADAAESRDETFRKIVATFSQRCAFSGSVLVLVLLGAVLGILFRGSHVVMAFGISFVPSLLVIITIVMGKQMAQNAATYLPGLLVMWSGIVVVAVLDGWVLTRVLRR